MSNKAKVFKGKAIICFLLAAIILLSGVCFEKIKVQSFFEYTTEHQKDAFVKEAGVKLVTSCSNETIGLRNSQLTTRSSARILPCRRFLRPLVVEIPLVEQLQSFSTFFSTANAVTFEQEHSKAEILFFIHSSDGKKRA